MPTAQCFRELQELTLPKEKYTTDERTAALGLIRGRSRRSVTFQDEEKVFKMPKTLALWHNVGFFILGVLMGVILGVTCHVLYNFHTKTTVPSLASYPSGRKIAKH